MRDKGLIRNKGLIRDEGLIRDKGLLRLWFEVYLLFHTESFASYKG